MEITHDQFVKQLENFGYEMKFEDNGVQHWSKQTALGVPLDKTSKEKPFVHVEYVIEERKVGFHLDAYAECGWVTVSIHDVDINEAFRRMKTLEERVCFGYRECYQ